MAIFIDGKQARGSLIVEGDLTMPLPTIDTASGSVATFDTDMTENLVEVECEIVYQQGGSGTPSPSNPRPITTYTSLNLSHSGADTSNPTVYNIPFGQTVANGVLNVTTGKLRVTHGYIDLGTLSWMAMSGDRWESSDLVSDILKPASNADIVPLVCSILSAKSVNDLYLHSDVIGIAVPTNGRLQCRTGDTVNTPTGDLVYPLATPQVIQLDSVQIQALLNENNIWCDTGDTEVKYLLTVGKKIS